MHPYSKRKHLSESYAASLQHIASREKQDHRTIRLSYSPSSSFKLIILFAILFSLSILTLSLVFSDASLLPAPSDNGGTKIVGTQLSFLLIFYALYFVAAVMALALKNLAFPRLSSFLDFMLLLALALITTPLALLYSYEPELFLLHGILTLLAILLGKIFFRQYSFAGINFYLANCLGVSIGLIWAGVFIYGLEVSIMTKILIWSTVPYILIALPSRFLHMLELYDVACRSSWKRPRSPLPKSWINHKPFVSIHVPTYSEPPELVIETLNKISEIDYTNYEVIIIDNNTEDSALWMPVQEHCNTLGDRFRFIHVDRLDGAKGGALNYALRCTDPRATIIGVIDADYHAEKNFPEALIGFFRDPAVGFVQSPHDYREWHNNLFLTMCYWEYRLFFHTAMVSLNERDAGITVGTMCLIRREALEKAGGWSEWCVTEDSELAIRIHDVGYSSVYVDKTFGRGLIPDNFEGYRKQRYRWTAGPVQEFRHYFAHFIGLSQKESRFNLKQRIFHLNHGFGHILIAFNIPLLLANIAIIASLIIHNEVVPVPMELWLVATITLLATPLLTFMLYRVTINATAAEIIGQAIATKALAHVISHAAFRTTLSGDAKWTRTSKFTTSETYASALYSTKEEITLGFCLMFFAVLSYVIFPHQGLSLMLLIGIAYVSLTYFAAPLMAMIGVWSHHHPSDTKQ